MTPLVLELTEAKDAWGIWLDSFYESEKSLAPALGDNNSNYLKIRHLRRQMTSGRLLPGEFVLDPVGQGFGSIVVGDFDSNGSEGISRKAIQV